MLKARRSAAALALLVLIAAPASAHDVYLVAKEFTNAAGITMWGFAQDADGFDVGNPEGDATSPGPVIRVPAGDTTLTIHVRNNLVSDDISLFVPGQTKTMIPVFVSDADSRRRVRSFDEVTTAAGGTNTYTWTGVKTGSYIYQSGTDVRTQIPMGLYGALIVDSAAGEAYADNPDTLFDETVRYDNDAILFFSEVQVDDVDPTVVAVPAGTDYQPQHFMINGASFGASFGTTAPIFDHAPVAGETLLLRFFNIGLDDAMPMLNGLTMNVIAEDGNLLPAASLPSPPGQHSMLLAAGKTMDALVLPGEGRYAIFDRSLRLDSGLGTGGNGGQMVYLEVGPPAANEAPVAFDDAYAVRTDETLTVTAPGVLANDTDVNGDPLNAVLDSYLGTGTLALAVDGSFTYTPATGFDGQETFTYFANDGTINSTAAATVTITVSANTAPVAADDAWLVNVGSTLNVPAPGVLSNDTDAEGDPLTAALVSGPSNGVLAFNSDGSFDYTPNAGIAGDSFTYMANDGINNSVAATVTITVNQPPVATNDAYATDEDTPLNVAAPGVLANDLDDFGPLVAALVAGPSNGALNFNTDGSFDYTPSAGWFGIDTFTYTASDGLFPSNVATVEITVNYVPGPVYFSTIGGGNNNPVPGVAAPYDDADIYTWDLVSFGRLFDASASGLPGNADIDGLVYVDDTSFYISFNRDAGTTLPGFADVFQDEDVLFYDGTTWSIFFDGSEETGGTGDNMGASAGQDIDAFDIVDGVLYFSTIGGGDANFIPGVAGPYDDADIYTWDGTTFGRFFDARTPGDNKLPANADIDGLSILDATHFYVSFNRNGGTDVAGIGTVQDEDVLFYDGTTGTWSLFFDGSADGMDVSNGQDIDAVHVD